ncbi:MAG TPA: hypothetical protein VGD79_02860 [Thermoanaerobaculia bacterium]|jgi:hypothetical protein
MGKQHAARLHVDGRTYEGEALLETAEILFRGERRLVIPFAQIKSIAAEDGRLVINGNTVLELGAEAAKWAEKIRNPKSVIQKLGVKAGQRVSVVHLDDDAFVADLEKAGCVVSRKAVKNSDAIFYGASSRDDLPRLAALKASLAQNGAFWVIRPKGVKTITEADTMAAGKDAGLVDVKVVKFSETHTAEKFVIRVVDRR